MTENEKYMIRCKGNRENPPLFALVKSLTKSEKRHFRLYAGRIRKNEDANYMRLFDLLEKQPHYNESEILKEGIVKKSQLPNLKAHLYHQILVSLRLNPSYRDVRVELREQLDFAYILYHKGFYKQSLKIFDKAKKKALRFEEKIVAYEIIESEKIIEAQYITRSPINREDVLSVEAKTVSRLNIIASKLSNLSLQLYGLILRKGYIKSKEELDQVKEYFHNRLPKFHFSELGFREKFWLYRAHIWYNHLKQDFVLSYKYSLQTINLFHEREDLIQINPVFFLKAYHYLLQSLFFMNEHSRFEQLLSQFERTISAPTFPRNKNLDSLIFLHLYSNKINNFLMHGRFAEGVQLADMIEKRIDQKMHVLDEHHVVVFLYKIACLYFGAGNFTRCIDCLKRIIDSKTLKVRKDIMSFSRVLSLIAHYEAGLDYHLESQLRSAYRYLEKMDDLYGVQEKILLFLKRIGDVFPHDIKSAFKQLLDELRVYENDPYEKRAFLYLDIISWLESKIQNRPVAEIVLEKFKSAKV